jgi:hypothetical protein
MVVLVVEAQPQILYGLPVEREHLAKVTMVDHRSSRAIS